jgi:hypothetical protein
MKSKGNDDVGNYWNNNFDNISKTKGCKLINGGHRPGVLHPDDNCPFPLISASNRRRYRSQDNRAFNVAAVTAVTVLYNHTCGIAPT